MKAAAMTVLVVGFFALALAGMPAPAEADCLDSSITYGPGGSAVLGSDITSCPDPAIQVTGPFTLDMAGHFVACTDSGQTGIKLVGTGVILKNGLVKDCLGSGSAGVALAGTGSHQVLNVVAKHNTTGFKVESSNNKLTNDSAFDGVTGF